MNHAAIKTTHLGVNFRSRLEAKYAQFFKNLGFKWQYEPEDMPGWIPDFVLYGPGGRKLYIEIKPLTCKGELDDTFLKIEKSIPDISINVAVLTPGFFYGDEFVLGFIRVKEKQDRHRVFWDYIALKDTQGGFDFSDLYFDWTNRLSGEHCKNFVDSLVLEYSFKRASNEVQWRA